MKDKIIRLILVLYILTSITFFVDLLFFIAKNESFNGYILERYIYLYSIFSSIYLIYSNRFSSIIKKYLKLSLIILLVSPLFYIAKSGKVGSNDEIILNDHLKLRENISLETSAVISVYENGCFFEKELTKLNNRIYIDSIEYIHLSEIDSARIKKLYKNKILIQFYKDHKSGNSEFEYKKNYR